MKFTDALVVKLVDTKDLKPYKLTISIVFVSLNHSQNIINPKFLIYLFN